MPNRYEIAVIPGDGTGPEVVAEGLKVLEALSQKCDLDFRFENFNVGGETYLKNELKSLDAGKMGYGTREVGDLVVGYL